MVKTITTNPITTGPTGWNRPALMDRAAGAELLQRGPAAPAQPGGDARHDDRRQVQPPADPRGYLARDRAAARFGSRAHADVPPAAVSSGCRPCERPGACAGS